VCQVTDGGGWTVRPVKPLTLLFCNFAQADRVLGLTWNTARAVYACYLITARSPGD